VYLLKAKSQTFKTFKNFRTLVENQTGRSIIFFRSDRGGEFTSTEFTSFFAEQGITHETSAPRTPQQNGVAERMNQTLLGGARAMLHHAGMTQGFWSEAIHVAAHILNRAPRAGLDWKTPYELMFGHKPVVTHLRVFGCRAWAFNDKAKKWEARSKPMIFIGYEIASKAYRLWDTKSRKVVISTNVKFDESDLPNKPTPTIAKPTPARPSVSSYPKVQPPDPHTFDAPWFFDDEEKPKPLSLPPSASTDKGKQRADKPDDPPSPADQDTPQPSQLPMDPPSPVPPSKTPDLPPPPSDQNDPGSESEVPTDTQAPGGKRPKRSRKKVEKYVAGTSGLGSAESEGELPPDFDEIYLNMVELYTSINLPLEPKNYAEAIKFENAERWNEAMKAEIKSLEDRGTWEIIDEPKDKPIVSCKWVYKVKIDSNGNVARHKARLVARGFSQTQGVDYKETFAPVTRLETIRMMFALAVEKDWEIRQVDVKNAYLYGDLDEEIYMAVPEGMDIPKGKCLRLLKALYGLKQAGRAWYFRLKSVMKEFGLTQVPCEPHLFVTRKMFKGKSLTLIIPVYVDDLFPIGNKKLTDQFEDWIGKSFDVTLLGDVQFFLGIRVIRYRHENPPYITLDQATYIRSILAKHRIDTEKTSKVPMTVSGANLVSREEDTVDSTPSTREEVRKYQSLIGSLMYLMLGTRPDIAFAVGKFARYAHDPSRAHFKALGRVFAYVNGTLGFALKYTRHEGNFFHPDGFCDADYAGELGLPPIRRKSTAAYCFSMAGGVFSWMSKLEPVIATSTMEAEYIAMYMAARQGIWIRQVFDAVGIPYDIPIEIMCDNQPAIAVAKGEGSHEAQKHIDIKFHYTREKVEEQKISFLYIPSNKNDADFLTKCVDVASFVKGVSEVGFAGAQEYIGSNSPSSISPPTDTQVLDSSTSSQFVSFTE
jgi:hypothetical protein